MAYYYKYVNDNQQGINQCHKNLLKDPNTLKGNDTQIHQYTKTDIISVKTTKVGEALNPEINTRNPEQIPEINTRNPEITKRGKSDTRTRSYLMEAIHLNFPNTRMARRQVRHTDEETSHIASLNHKNDRHDHKEVSITPS